MQILGRKSKFILAAICAAMLIAIGISFAAWDLSAVVKADGNTADYANAKVGDIIEFGNYYDYEKDASGNYVANSQKIDKYPITWIVVDKDERTGQLTLMSQYILACGSYFGNYYDDGNGMGWRYASGIEVGRMPYNQAYCDSTVRAYLNNLERLDMGGDLFVESDSANNTKGGYIPSGISATTETGLLSSVGFSNQHQWTGLKTTTYTEYASNLGFVVREDKNSNELYYKRPLSSAVYADRPMAKGFYDEAFTNDEKSKIRPRTISGYIGHRWPDKAHNIATKRYIEGTVDKIWIPSTTELNIMDGRDWNGNPDEWSSSSDMSGSTVFEFFKNPTRYMSPYNRSKKCSSLEEALIGRRTNLAMNGKMGNYSIPVYKYKSTDLNTDIKQTSNTSNNYWTRTPSSYWYGNVRSVGSSTGWFSNDWDTAASDTGVRPCITLQY